MSISLSDLGFKKPPKVQRAQVDLREADEQSTDHQFETFQSRRRQSSSLIEPARTLDTCKSMRSSLKRDLSPNSLPTSSTVIYLDKQVQLLKQQNQAQEQKMTNAQFKTHELENLMENQEVLLQQKEEELKVQKKRF